METIWSQKRVTAFIIIWNLLAPLKLIFTTSSFYFYAGAWMYIPNNPFSDIALVISPLVIAFMFPFYIPGIIIASYVWNSFKNPNLTRYRYSNRILMLQVIYILLVWVLIPCPYSTTAPLCVPVPSTGFVALLFASKVVKKVDAPWTDDSLENPQ